MNILNKLFSPKISKKDLPVSYLYLINGDFIANAGISDLNLAREGFIKNIIAYRCITLISDQASLMTFNLFQNDKELIKHPLIELLKNPYPTLAQQEFLKSIFIYRLIYGQSYIWMQDTNKSSNYIDTEPVFLYPLRPDYVTVNEGNNFLPSSYVYNDGRNSYKFNVTINGKSNIIHIKTINPINEYLGLSPLIPASFSIDMHNESQRWNYNLLRNGARPSGILELPAEVELNDNDRKRLTLEITEAYSGSENAGKPIVLTGGMKFVPMSLNPKDMDFTTTEKTAAYNIALAFGVPMDLLNKEQAKYDNLRSAQEQLFDEAVMPLVKNLMTELNMCLVPRYGDNLELKADFSYILASQIKKDNKALILEKVSYLTINEKREQIGYEALPDGDVLPAKSPSFNLEGMKLDFINNEIKQGIDAAEALKLADLVYAKKIN